MIRNALFSLAALATLTTPMMATAADAQRYDRHRDYGRDRGRDRDGGRDYRWHGDERDWNPRDDYRERRGGERRLGRNDRIYRGNDGRAYCRRNDGTTGLVIGGVGGAALGNLVGGGLLGTLAGGGAGALLGRSIDRGNVKCR